MSPLYENRDRAESFGASAVAYDQLRPSYPSDLIEWLAPAPGGVAVDVGCGTGQVSRLLRAAGWKVVSVEVDERMAAIARASGIDVHVSRFEDWHPPVEEVDLVCSGQAWHWIDPAIGYQKAAEVLRPGGRLAMFWNTYHYEASVAHAISEAGAKHAPELLVDSVPLGTVAPSDGQQFPVPDRLPDPFGPTDWRTFSHAREQSIDDWIGELLTHSVLQHLSGGVTASLLADLRDMLHTVTSGALSVHYETVVASATTIDHRP